jgi:transcriptional regulator with XRE-family HTH domain
MTPPRTRPDRGAGSKTGAFGRLLKDWRGRRGLSQLDLALAARTTQRYLSFIESGRAGPSREMILRLAATMHLPLRQQNALMLAAGYAPVWRERDLSAPDLAAVDRALDFMLARHEPYPAFVVDRRWNLLRANRGAAKLTQFLTGSAAAADASASVNLAVAMLSPDGLRSTIVNWPEVALHLLRGVEADARADGAPETADLYHRLLALPDVAALGDTGVAAKPNSPVLSLHFRRGECSLQLFTTIATLGTPRDVTLDEVRIEFFFPADEATARRLADWQAEG